MSHDTPAELRQTLLLGEAFKAILSKTYGHLRAPEPIVTPTGIAHLDALLGGGIVSSGPVLFSSTPETGKSTFAFQFSSIFQKTYPNGLVVYLDIEASGNVASSEFRVNRTEAFGIDMQRFKYEPIVLDVMQVFELIETLVSLKKQFEDKIGKEFHILIVWDSIASTPSSKVDTAENHNQVIGHKARQLSFCLEKYSPLLKFNRITFIGIDQVRADMKIEGPYAQKESSVGTFKDIKSATNIYALMHNVQQWVFLSKKKQISLAEGIGIDGWYVDIHSEKNKLAPSKHSITCVFDKNHGLDKFWSEYTFLEEVTPSEKKIFKDKTPPFPFMIKKSGNQIVLQVSNPDDASINYKSQPMFRKNAKKMYDTSEEFRGWFDYAVQLSVYYRIVKGIFQHNIAANESPLGVPLDEEISAPLLDEYLPNEAMYETQSAPVLPPTLTPSPLSSQSDDEEEGSYESVFV